MSSLNLTCPVHTLRVKKKTQHNNDDMMGATSSTGLPRAHYQMFDAPQTSTKTSRSTPMVTIPTMESNNTNGHSSFAAVISSDEDLDDDDDDDMDDHFLDDDDTSMFETISHPKRNNKLSMLCWLVYAGVLLIVCCVHCCFCCHFLLQAAPHTPQVSGRLIKNISLHR